MWMRKPVGRKDQTMIRNPDISPRISAIRITEFCDEILGNLNGLAPDQSNCYAVGPHQVIHNVYGSALGQFMTPALAHIVSKPGDTPDYRIWSIQGDAIPFALPRPFWSWQRIDTQGFILDIDSTRFTAHYDAMTMTFRLLDRERRIGIHWVREFDKLPYWERSFPLRTMFHWIFRDTPLQPVHAACVGNERAAVLLAAKGGSGKSTTALTCLFDGMQYVGDDFVLVDSNTCEVHSMYNVVKLKPEDVELYPEFRHLLNPVSSDQEKTQIFLSDYLPDQLERTTEIQYILVPRIDSSSDNTTVSEISREEVISALATSTFYLLKGDNTGTYRKISNLVDRVPCYYLNLGRNRQVVSREIQNILEHGPAV